MSGIPVGFGKRGGPSAVGAPNSKKDASKKDASKKIPIVRQHQSSPKKRTNEVVDLDKTEDASLKHHKPGPASLVSAELGPLVAPFVKDDELKIWKGMSLEDENKALIKASAHILSSALGRASKIEKYNSRLMKLETDKYNMCKQLKEIEVSHKTELERKDSLYGILSKEAKAQKDKKDQLQQTLDEQNSELTTLRARLEKLEEEKQNGWLAEKTKIAYENFERGFRFYVTGFLATDPDYSFEKFGEETVNWIADYKVSEAAAINAKRIELGLEVASPTEDAPEASVIQEEIQPSSKDADAAIDQAANSQIDAPESTLPEASQPIPTNEGEQLKSPDKQGDTQQ